IPEEGDESIDEKQIFVLSLDGAAAPDSVISHAFCSVEGIQERFGVKIIEGNEKEQLLKALEYRLHPSWMREEQKGREEHLLLLQCRQAFPPKAAVKLVWGKGISSGSGMKTSEDQAISFRAREPFSVRFSCMRERADADCIPLAPIVLSFSEPVAWKTVQGIEVKGSAGKIWRPKRQKDEEDSGDELQRVVIEGPFPERSSLTIFLPQGLKDDSGRELGNRDEFPMVVKTESYSPLAKFSSRFGIIESGEGAALPVTVRNLEADLKTWLRQTGGKPSAGSDQLQAGDRKADELTAKLRSVSQDQETEIISWLRRLAAAERERSLLKGKEGNQLFSLPLPAGPKAFEVVGIPMKRPGFYLVEIESKALGSRLLESKAPMYVPAGALVTNMAAHFKWGKESSLVWVTGLDKGLPVAGADITLRDCKGKEVWKGKTDSNGLAQIKAALPGEADLPHCPTDINYAESAPGLGGMRGGLFVFARTKDDMTFTHSSWDNGIEAWRFHLPGFDSDTAGAAAHTILDRSLLRAGETVHMKHVLRKRTQTGFSFLPSPDLPDEVVVEHMGSEQRQSFPISWSSQGTAETEWRIPEGARLGTYRISLVKKMKARKAGEEPEERSWPSGSFRVEEFRVPLMKAIIQPPKDPLIRPAEAELDLAVSYLSGGGASNLPVRLRSELQPRGITLPDYEGFTFSNGTVKEGIETTAGEESGEQQEQRTRLRTMDLSLDKAGTARVKVSGIPEVTEPEELLTELEFRDPNGEVQTASARIPLYPSPWLIGLKPADWAASKDAVRYTVAVTDLKGTPVQGAEVGVRLLQVKNYTHRRRITGGFYGYEQIREVKGLGEHCKGRTDAKGLLFCEARSPVSGSIVLLAEVKDPLGNTASVNREVWAAGGEDWWFEMGNDDRIDLIPEKKRYEPGDTARLQLRMPFREATALVTVEREGIMDSFVTKISRSNPVVELPVKGNYAPNCFVSVLTVRGRVTDKKPTALFDPGRPAYKLGIGEINVGWKAQELKLKVSPERDVYKVRERAKVLIQARTAFGTPPPKGTEVAVAAVDEGLLELMPNESWKLLEGMMSRRGYGVMTATAQMMVVGKRHFGRKAL
ncbi:MAG: MG2 domain-containing protein, partial [Thermodesulfovibrionales bacterium]